MAQQTDISKKLLSSTNAEIENIVKTRMDTLKITQSYRKFLPIIITTLSFYVERLIFYTNVILLGIVIHYIFNKT